MAALAFACLLAGAPSAAASGVVTESGGELIWQPQAGDVINEDVIEVEMSDTGDPTIAAVTFRTMRPDPLDVIDVAATADECMGDDTPTVVCTMPRAGLDIRVSAGEGDDQLTAEQDPLSLAPVVPVKLFGGEGADSLFGSEVRDILAGGPGIDTIAGGPGDDVIYGADEPAPGATGDSSADTLDGGPGADTIDGGGGDDEIDGGPDADSLAGGEGNDTITGGAEEDTIVDGGDGEGDRILYDEPDRTAGVTVNLSDAAPDGSAPGGTEVAAGFERVTGSGFVDSIVGTDEANQLDGGGANDQLAGLAGDDILEGSAGDDTLVGGTGGDVLSGGEGRDATSYADRTSGVSVTVDAGSGDDGAASDAGAGGVRDSVTGIEEITGSAFGDTIVGSNGGELLVGNDGNDVLTGLGGVDTFQAGAGADDLRAVDGIAESVDCGPDFDTSAADPIDQLTGCEPPPAQPAAREAFGASTLVTLSLRARRVRAGRPLPVVVSNRNAFSISGGLAAETAKRVAGSPKRRLKLSARSFQVAARSRRTVNLKVSKRLGRLLQRRGKLALRLRATIRDPVGNSRTVRKTVTPLAAKKRARAR